MDLSNRPAGLARVMFDVGFGLVAVLGLAGTAYLLVTSWPARGVGAA